MSTTGPRSLAGRALFAALWLAVGLVIGAAASAWLLRGSLSDPVDRRQEAAVPEACLDAIGAARARLLLNEETTELAGSYPSLLRRAADAVAALEVGEIGELAKELDGLNEKSRTLLERSRSTNFVAPAAICEATARTDGG